MKQYKRFSTIGLLALAVIVLTACGTPVTTNTTVTNSAANANAGANTNIANVNANINTQDDANIADVTSDSNAVYTGKVFLKGYDTPSESYGILTDEGSEIGFGSYDSMKEQFRQYLNDNLKVTFSSICRSGRDGCCRTLFPFCGTVKSFEPIK